MATKKLSVFSLAKEVGLGSGVLILRSKAGEMFDLSLNRAGMPHTGDVLICDFSGIIDCSASFVDEFIISWLSKILSIENTMLVLAEMTDDVEYTINSALNLKNKMDKKNFVLIAKAGGKYHIAGGKLESNVQDVFDLLAQGERVTARMVVDRFNTELNGAGNRLRKLYNAHVTLRTEQSAESGGKLEYFLP